MADRGRTHHALKTIERVKTWQLVVLFILVAFVAATFLRLNNIGMVERRTAVLNADAAGDIDATTARLYDLQQYVSSHMNTDMGQGIYLQSLYQKDRQAAINTASARATPSGGIYKQINDACKAEFHTYTPYFQCVTDKLAAVPNGPETLTATTLPTPDEYHYVFAPPLWSPDFAGFSVLVAAVILLLIVVRLISTLILRLMLRRHHQHI